MSRRFGRLAVLVCATITLTTPASAQLVEHLPTRPLSLLEMFAADHIVLGTIKSIDADGRPLDLVGKYVRIKLKIAERDDYFKGRPDLWPADGEFPFEIAIPLATQARVGDRVLWFLKSTGAGFETMGHASGYFNVFADDEYRYSARSVNGSKNLWAGAGGLWRISDRPEIFRNQVEARIRAFLQAHVGGNPNIDIAATTTRWMNRGSAPHSRGKLPLGLLIAVIESYLPR